MYVALIARVIIGPVNVFLQSETCKAEANMMLATKLSKPTPCWGNKYKWQVGYESSISQGNLTHCFGQGAGALLLVLSFEAVGRIRLLWPAAPGGMRRARVAVVGAAARG